MHIRGPRTADGYVIRGDAAGKVVEADTHQCCHCGRHFEMVRGSGKVRGYCFRCGAITCGPGPCDICIPMEARLEHLEGKRNAYSPLIEAQEIANAIR